MSSNLEVVFVLLTEVVLNDAVRRDNNIAKANMIYWTVGRWNRSGNAAHQYFLNVLAIGDHCRYASSSANVAHIPQHGNGDN